MLVLGLTADCAEWVYTDNALLEGSRCVQVIQADEPWSASDRVCVSAVQYRCSDSAMSMSVMNILKSIHHEGQSMLCLHWVSKSYINSSLASMQKCNGNIFFSSLESQMYKIKIESSILKQK